MVIDYIGQELIWNLTATHPYKQSHGNYSIMINCETLKQNKDAVRFLKSHLGSKLLTVETRKYLDENTGLECVLVSKISVPDAEDIADYDDEKLFDFFYTDVQRGN